jgi:hypothetical protein
VGFLRSTRHAIEVSAREQAVLYLKSDEADVSSTPKMAARARATFEEFWPTLDESDLELHPVIFQYEDFAHLFCPEKAAAQSIWNQAFASVLRDAMRGPFGSAS